MEDFEIYEEIIRLQKGGVPAALTTIVESNGSCPRKTGAKMVVRYDGSIVGTIGGGKTEAEVIGAAIGAIRQRKPTTLSFSLTEQHGSVCGGKLTVFIEPIIAPPQLVVVGGGHVGQAVAGAARNTGFAVSLIDPEELDFELTEKSANRYGADGLAKLFSSIGVDNNSYLFIATRDHQKDFAVVKSALATDACYIGMIGSKRKRLALEKVLAEADFDKEDVARVVSPAGLEIGAETPEEIAVSIVAQLIQVRRTLHGAADSGHIAGGGPVEEDGAQQTVVAAWR